MFKFWKYRVEDKSFRFRWHVWWHKDLVTQRKRWHVWNTLRVNSLIKQAFIFIVKHWFLLIKKYCRISKKNINSEIAWNVFARTFPPLYSNHVTNVYFYLALEYLNFCFFDDVAFFLWFIMKFSSLHHYQ